MGRENLGSTIREFFRELFGSRLAERLDEELMRTREDCDGRIVEYQHQQAQFRQEIAQLRAKIEKYEMVLLPMVYGNLGGKKEPTFIPSIEDDPDSWAAIRARHAREQEEEAQQEQAN